VRTRPDGSVQGVPGCPQAFLAHDAPPAGVCDGTRLIQFGRRQPTIFGRNCHLLQSLVASMTHCLTSASGFGRLPHGHCVSARLGCLTPIIPCHISLGKYALIWSISFTSQRSTAPATSAVLLLYGCSAAGHTVAPLSRGAVELLRFTCINRCVRAQQHGLSPQLTQVTQPLLDCAQPHACHTLLIARRELL
jgi:hypothetical protein